jgi:hypothetical protein
LHQPVVSCQNGDKCCPSEACFGADEDCGSGFPQDGGVILGDGGSGF